MRFLFNRILATLFSSKQGAGLLCKIFTHALRWSYKYLDTETYAHAVQSATARICGNLTFSLEGEDLLVRRILGKKRDGFYVDVGAHHPIRYSNTFLFYLNGWNGVNIDPMPGSMEEFKKIRRRDVNLEIGVDIVPGHRKYFCFDDPALNTFSESVAEEYKRYGRTIEQEMQVPVVPLAKILSDNVAKERKIDFLNIDVEGMEHVVLESNDWERYAPDIVLLEEGVVKARSSALLANEFLVNKQYSLVARTVYTGIYAGAWIDIKKMALSK